MQQNIPPLHTLWTQEILRWRLGMATSGTPFGASPPAQGAAGHTGPSSASIVPDAILPDAMSAGDSSPAPSLSGTAPCHDVPLEAPSHAPASQQETDAPPPPGQDSSCAPTLSRDMIRVARLAAHGDRRHVLLLGTPSPDEIEALLGALPDHVRLVACSMSPETARIRFGTACEALRWHRPMPDERGTAWCIAAAQTSPCTTAEAARTSPDAKPPFLLLCDTSPWALLLLLYDAGVAPEGTLVAFSHAQGDDERPLLRQLRRLFLSATRMPPPPLPLPASPSDTPPLHVCAILHPHESGLDTFFAQFPDWIASVTVVWDGEMPPSTPGCAIPVRHACRLLDADFAAQRNAMLDATPRGWVVYLDADEILSPETWTCLRAWAAHAAVIGIGGVALPRNTFLPDGQTIRVGFGLWPDIQLRMFRNAPGIRFEGRIHERVTGLHGGFVLLPGHPILHHSLTSKDRHAVEARLRTFDLAAGRPLHRLSEEYPGLPRLSFETAARHWGGAALYFCDV